MPCLTGAVLTVTAGEEWLEDYWDKIIPVVEARLVEHGKPFIGGTSKPTIADFKAFQSLTGSLYNSVSPVPHQVLLKL